MSTLVVGQECTQATQGAENGDCVVEHQGSGLRATFVWLVVPEKCSDPRFSGTTDLLDFDDSRSSLEGLGGRVFTGGPKHRGSPTGIQDLLSFQRSDPRDGTTRISPSSRPSATWRKTLGGEAVTLSLGQ